MSEKRIILADLDGTIADIEHRRHWLDEAKHPDITPAEQWHLFFADCPNDAPNWPVIAVLESFRQSTDHLIHILSGRSDEVKEQTVSWLTQYRIPYDLLRMRQAGDFTPDEVLKEGWLMQYEKDRILFVLDDRASVTRMWRRHGLVCLQVAEGDF